MLPYSFASDRQSSFTRNTAQKSSLLLPYTFPDIYFFMGKQSTSLKEFINTYIFPQLPEIFYGLRKQCSTLRDLCCFYMLLVWQTCLFYGRKIYTPLRDSVVASIYLSKCQISILAEENKRTALREFNVAFMYFFCQASILVWCSNRLLRESPLLLPYASTSVRHLFMHKKAKHNIEIFRYCIHIQLPTNYFYVKKQQTAF